MPERGASKPRRSTFGRDNFSGSFCRFGWVFQVGIELKYQDRKVFVFLVIFLLNFLFYFICFIKPLLWGAKLAQGINAILCSEILG
jgi:hypothetical protein